MTTRRKPSRINKHKLLTLTPPARDALDALAAQPGSPGASAEASVAILERYQHMDRDYASGRYTASPACDGCGKPVGAAYYTDEEVCGGGDGPGFFLCDRKRCVESREGISVEDRCALYEQTRAIART